MLFDHLSTQDAGSLAGGQGPETDKFVWLPNKSLDLTCEVGSSQGLCSLSPTSLTKIPACHFSTVNPKRTTKKKFPPGSSPFSRFLCILLGRFPAANGGGCFACAMAAD